MVEQVNNNGQLINEGIQIEEFASQEENIALSETVDNLRKEADTSSVKTPKQPVVTNPDSTVDIVESGDEGLSLFEDDAPAPQLKAPVQEPQKVIQEQKQVFTQKQESGEFAKYDESAIALAANFIDNQFNEEASIGDGLQDLGLLDLPEEEAANVIMQTAEILGEVETPESDTKMNFIEDVDALLMSRPQNEVVTSEESSVPVAEVILEEPSLNVDVPEVITEAPKDKPVVAKKAPPAPKVADPTAVQENQIPETPVVETPVSVTPTVEVPAQIDMADPLEVTVDLGIVRDGIAEPTLNKEIVETKLEISEGVLQQAKLEAELQPKVIPEDMSELEVVIQEEEKIADIKNQNTKSQIESLQGELSVAEGELSSSKASLAALGGNADQIIDQAVATASIQTTVVSSAPKVGGENSSSGGAVTSTIKKSNKPAPSAGADKGGAIQTATANITAASGQVGTLSSQISGLEAELDS
ncbi:MAG: hypothetical protein HRT47_00730 [Candidatus Caenarcaniphilales bacterium]|nr:hypothetical protein [Candidatus Caenarcaniphilales bacterium]